MEEDDDDDDDGDDKRHDFRGEKVTEHKTRVLILSATFV